MSEPATAHVMTFFHPPTRLWYYIPTDPEARKWRGPFTEPVMDREITRELGQHWHATQTKVWPRHLTCKYPDCDGGPATGYCHVSCRQTDNGELIEGAK